MHVLLEGHECFWHFFILFFNLKKKKEKKKSKKKRIKYLFLPGN